MNYERFLNYLRYEKRFSPHTLAAYESDMRQFSSFLQSVYDIENVTDIHAIHIRSWMVKLLEQGNTTRSINRKLSCLKVFFRFQISQGLLHINPMAKVTSPKTGKRLPVFVQEKSMSLLFDQVDFGEGYSGFRNRMIIELLYCTGMRRSELIGLKIRDVDTATNQIKVTGKGNKERLIPVASYLIKVLEQYLLVRNATYAQHPDHHLFLSDKGQPLYAGFVYNVVRRYLSFVTTLEQRSPHVLRHSFATHLSNHGASLNAIKELLGHANLAATQVYTHNSIEKLKNVYKQAHPKATLPPVP